MAKVSCWFAIILICLCIVVAGCVSDYNTSAVSGINPFDDIAGGHEILMSEYGHSPYIFPNDDTFHYYGGLFEVPYIFYGGQVDSEVGLLIFIDGIVQPYSLHDDTSEVAFEYMHVFNIEANSEKVVMLSIAPTVGEIGDNLQLNFVCIDFPLINDMSMLKLQGMSTTFSWRLSFFEDIVLHTAAHTSINASISDFSSDVDMDVDIYGYFHLEVDEGSGIVRFIDLMEEEGEYRVTLFINNTPVRFNGGKTHFDINSRKGEKIVYDFKIDDYSLSSLNIVYAISIRLVSGEENNQVDVFKTISRVLNVS